MLPLGIWIVGDRDPEVIDRRTIEHHVTRDRSEIGHHDCEAAIRRARDHSVVRHRHPILIVLGGDLVLARRNAAEIEFAKLVAACVRRLFVRRAFRLERCIGDGLAARVAHDPRDARIDELEPELDRSIDLDLAHGCRRERGVRVDLQ